MRTNLAIAALVYPMVQAVAFGAGLLILLALGAPPAAFAPVIAATFVVSAPIALLMAPPAPLTGLEAAPRTEACAFLAALYAHAP
jgi:hypothetical protein